MLARESIRQRPWDKQKTKAPHSAKQAPKTMKKQASLQGGNENSNFISISDVRKPIDLKILLRLPDDPFSSVLGRSNNRKTKKQTSSKTTNQIRNQERLKQLC